MSLLKELKEDIGIAVSELSGTEKEEEAEVQTPVSTEEPEAVFDDSDMVDTLGRSALEELDLGTINNILDDVQTEINEEEIKEEVKEEVKEEEPADDLNFETAFENEPAFEAEEKEEDIPMDNSSAVQEEPVKAENTTNIMEGFEDSEVSDEVTEITKGTSITGSISSMGSVNVFGRVNGDVSCKGKLIITGMVKGTSAAGEIYANNSKIEGDLKSEGSVKVGNGSIIVGNVIATSAVIGGAVKGDIDVHGPVIVDATAVIQGNIKSRSVQINNGAAIEGFCSQCYADIDYKALFDETFGH